MIDSLYISRSLVLLFNFLTPVGELWRPSDLRELPPAVLLDVRLLPDRDYVHGGLWRRLLPDRLRENIPRVLPPRRLGECTDAFNVFHLFWLGECD